MTSLFDSLQAFLHARSNEFNRDLVERFLSADSPEVQVNIRTDVGRPLEDNPRTRTDGDFEFYNIRFPKDPGTAPVWDKRLVNFPLDDYCESIGSTGYSRGGSLWVGFDVDTIFGHAPGHGVSDAEIGRIDRALEVIPYVELRRSTRGLGRHIYVTLAGVSTSNHTEHAAVARAVLGKLCLDAGFDFAPAVDVCGGNLWIYSRASNRDNRGFECLKAPRSLLQVTDILNWRDHLDVVQRTRSKVRVTDLDEDSASSYPSIRKDGEHERIFDEYKRHGYSLLWQPDHGCFQLHTAGLAKAHKSLGLRGAFETVSQGDDPGQPNAFGFLRPHGALFVVRFGSTTEHPLWAKTAKGQPCATFNMPLESKAVCRAVNAIPTKSGFSCPSFEQAKGAAQLFGFSLPILEDRQFNFLVKPGRVVVEADRHGKEQAPEWGVVGRKFQRSFEIDSPPREHAYDDRYRHVVSPANEDAGWRVRRTDGSWGCESKDTLRDMMYADGIDPVAIPAVLGHLAQRPWVLVNEPFQPVFMVGRRWNRGRQLLYVPTQDTERQHPHFDMILEHCGRNLDDAVAEDEWCQRHGVTDGAAYLLLWSASLIQRPKHPLPYLFFFSPENNTGKSSFYRALGMLFEGGATDVHAALMETFNGQMAGAVLCYVEERVLNPSAYAKLKAWVDSPTISIREMRTNAYTLPNYAHFVQTANDQSACPIEPHDERIVVVKVDPLKKRLPWTDQLEPALRLEAPDFLATLLVTTLPPAEGRLFLPVLHTVWKDEIMADKKAVERRSEIIDALVVRIRHLISTAAEWQGFGGNLQEALGPGPWSGSAGTLVQYLAEAATKLAQFDIVVSFSPTRTNGRRTINIGRSWLIEPDWPGHAFADDEARTSELYDSMPNTCEY